MKRGKYFPHPARLGDQKKEGIEVDHRRRRRLLRWRRGYGCRRRGNEAGERAPKGKRKKERRAGEKRGREVDFADRRQFFILQERYPPHWLLAAVKRPT